MSIIDEIKGSFKSGSVLTKLIYVNLGVFLVIKLIGVIEFLFNIQSQTGHGFVSWLAVPADINNLITRPWTIITYMFLHVGFLHILFNLLWLYIFGKIFLSYIDEKKLLNVYLLGGLAGAGLYILAFNLFPVFENALTMSYALGASAAVLAIVIVISVYKPDYSINLLFLGPVKLKYIAIFVVVLDIISIASDNSGGHIAHLGGALFGYIFTKKYEKGKDISRGFGKFMEGIFSYFKPKKKMKVTYKRPGYKNAKAEDDLEYNKRKASEQMDIDRILDKIAQSGYKSLTKKEKELLFKASKEKDH